MLSKRIEHGHSIGHRLNARAALFPVRHTVSYLGLALGPRQGSVTYVFRRLQGAHKSVHNSAEPLSQTHHLIAEILPELRPAEMQTVYFQCMKDGPESLLAPIEAEFARRGLSPHVMTFGSWRA